MVTEVKDMDAIKDGNVLVDFYTTTCGPCLAMNPVLEEISREYDNLKIAKIEVTKNPKMSQQFGVMSVPTIMFLKNSKVQEISQGFRGKEAILTIIKKYV